MIPSVTLRAVVAAMACYAAGASIGIASGASLERVEFSGAPALPSDGIQGGAGANPGDRLQGWLARPEGSGPYPAVVALHGCGGPERKRMQDVADALVSWGYIVLFVDSFSTRGIHHLCTPDRYATEKNTVARRPSDAVAGLRYLASQPSADTSRAAVVGFSQGAETALTIAEQLSPATIGSAGNPGFRAAVAFYPPCRRAGARPGIPTLIPIGALDDWTPAKDCERLVTGWGDTGVPVELVVYADAYHSFDAPAFSPGMRLFDHWIEYNREAAAGAYRKMQEFLQRHLGK